MRDAVGDRLHISEEFVKDGVGEDAQNVRIAAKIPYRPRLRLGGLSI